MPSRAETDRMIEILFNHLTEAKKRTIEQITSEFPSIKMIDILAQIHCSMCQEVGRLEALLVEAGSKDSPSIIALLRNAAIKSCLPVYTDKE